MPPLIIPPLVKWTLAAFGGAALMHWAAKQIRRVNEEIDRVSRVPVADPIRRKALPTLRRDPQTGDYRVM